MADCAYIGGVVGWEGLFHFIFCVTEGKFESDPHLWGLSRLICNVARACNLPCGIGDLRVILLVVWLWIIPIRLRLVGNVLAAQID